MQAAQLTIAQMASEAAARYRDLDAYTCLGKTLSFQEVEVLSDAFASWLAHEAGVRPGARVAIMLPNLLQYPVAALGAFKAGAVVVNVNPLYTPYELQRILIDSDVSVLVLLANVAHTAAAVLEHTQVRKVVITEVGDLLGVVRGWMTNFAVRHIRKLIRHYHIAGAVRFARVLQQGRTLQMRNGLPTLDHDPESVAVLQYTGGTTGVMKAAMLSHRNLLSNVEQMIVSMDDLCPGKAEVMVAPLPLYHIYAFSLNILLNHVRGHHVVLIPNPRNIEAMVKALSAVRMNGFIGINTLYQNLLNHEGFRKLDFSHLRVSTSGGMALSEQVVLQWEQLTGTRIVEGYGLTECSPLVACTSKGNYKRGTCGKVVPDTELCLVKFDGTFAARGEPGEIWVKGPQVMSGYWNNAAETSLVFDKEGWLRTGDVGVMDADGYLSIVDRIKDLIVISGFNVYPYEIEEVALQHPAIKEACAVGCGDELAPRIKLFVVSNEPELSSDAVIMHCRKGLASYKVPKEVEFRQDLPKSPVGKILRRELKQSATAVQ